MKSLKITLAALTLTLFANISIAQEQNGEKKTPEERATAQTEKMSEKLLFSPEQKTQVYDINLAIDQKNEAVRNDKNMSEETRKASIQGNNDARKEMIKAILNPEQVKKFEEMEVKRDARYEKKVQKVDFKKLEQKPVEATPAEK
jgi:broad specificity polyphosphatase/5'/3'-nucleotidase SurE